MGQPRQGRMDHVFGVLWPPIHVAWRTVCKQMDFRFEILVQNMVLNVVLQVRPGLYCDIRKYYTLRMHGFFLIGQKATTFKT